MTLKDHALMNKCFISGSYYLIGLMVLLWIGTGLDYLRVSHFSWSTFIHAHKKGIFVSLILCVIIAISVKPALRVLSDETNLLSVSQSMTFEKRVNNTTQGTWYYESFYPDKNLISIEKRPLLFPFFTHLVHVILGYRAENVYLLNLFVLFFLLLIVFLILQHSLKDLWAVSAMILVVSQPVVTQCARSGGFDLFFSAFVLLSFVVFRTFLRERSTSSFKFLWMTLVMVSQTRHEGILFFSSCIFVILAFRLLKKEYFEKPLLYVLSLFPFLPMVWPRLLNKDYFENAKNEIPFSVVHFLNNNMTFFKNLVSFDYWIPYATLVNLIGVLGLLHLMFSGEERSGDPGTTAKNIHFPLIIVATISLILEWVFITSYFRGNSDHPTNSRYFVLFSIVLALSAVRLVHRSGIFRKQATLFFVFCVSIFVLYHPVSVENRFTFSQTAPRQYAFAIDFLKKVGHRNFLFITDRPGQYTVHRYGAISFDRARKQPKKIKSDFERHLYKEIYVLQEIEYASASPAKSTSLPREFKLETLVELQNTATSFLRISKVKEIQELKTAV